MLVERRAGERRKERRALLANRALAPSQKTGREREKEAQLFFQAIMYKAAARAAAAATASSAAAPSARAAGRSVAAVG